MSWVVGGVGQPAPDPNLFIEPTWTQICVMGYRIPGIGVIGGDVVAGIRQRFDSRIARALFDETTGIVIETSLGGVPTPRDAPIHPETRRHLPVPGLPTQRQTRRARPRHPLPPGRTLALHLGGSGAAHDQAWEKMGS